jgi:hypothetical protein
MNQSVALRWLQLEWKELKIVIWFTGVNDDNELVLLNVDLMHSPANGEIMWEFISHRVQ